MKHKGAFNIVWIFGAILFVIAPLLLGMLLGGLLKDMPMVAYYIVGYVLLFTVDMLISIGIMKVPMPLALVLAIILPFVQGMIVRLTTT